MKKGMTLFLCIVALFTCISGCAKKNEPVEDNDTKSEKTSENTTLTEEVSLQGTGDYVVYFKNNELFCYDLETEKSFQLSEQLYSGGNISEHEGYIFEEGDEAYVLSGFVSIYRPGKTIFYPDHIELNKDECGVPLYCRSLEEDSKSMLIDTNVYFYTINDDADIVTYIKHYENENHEAYDELCRYNFTSGKVEEICKDTDKYFYFVSADGETLLYLDYDKDKWIIMDENGNTTELKYHTGSRDVYTDKNLENIFYVKEDGLLYKSIHGGSETLVSDLPDKTIVPMDKVQVVSGIDSNGNEILPDDYDADAVFVDEVYVFESGEAYFTLSNNNYSEDKQKELYYYDGNKSALVSDSYRKTKYAGRKNAVLVFGDGKYDDTSFDSYAAVKGNAVLLDITGIYGNGWDSGCAGDEAGNILYIQDSNTGDLQEIKYDENGNLTGKVLDKDTRPEIYVLDNDLILYFTEENTLINGDAFSDCEVFEVDKEKKQVVLLTWDDELKLYDIDNKTEIKLGSCSYAIDRRLFTFTNKGTVAYVDEEEGNNLWLYNNITGEKTQIDDNVGFLFRNYNQKNFGEVYIDSDFFESSTVNKDENLYEFLLR